MTKQRITVELDHDTSRDLAAIGTPTDVLTRLAISAADAARRAGTSQRDQTDASLRVERASAAAGLAEETVEADEVVRIARQRADYILQIARGDADRGRSPEPAAGEASSDRERARADDTLEEERFSADAVLEQERAARRHKQGGFLSVEREATDQDMSAERAHADTLVIDQREANTQMVRATIRAQELAEKAQAAEERAVESERELRVMAEFRELFIGILGHDLRNPLAAISMSAGILLGRGRLNEQDARTVARIVDSSQRMTLMIAQLLDLTRARLGGGLPLEVKHIDLQDVCRRVVEEFGTTVRLDVEGDVTGTWDPDRFAAALSNLVGNAIEHAIPGTVVTARAYADGSDVVVEVSNEGKPIPEGLLPFIFEPFRGAMQREKSATGNLGLGLYIAKQIVLAHGGTLGTHCAEGTTTFVMRLPRSFP